MVFSKIKPKRHGVQIKLKPNEVDWLLSAMWEAKSYAADCGESTTRHETFILELQEVLD